MTAEATNWKGHRSGGKSLGTVGEGAMDIRGRCLGKEGRNDGLEEGAIDPRGRCHRTKGRTDTTTTAYDELKFHRRRKRDNDGRRGIFLVDAVMQSSRLQKGTEVRLFFIPAPVMHTSSLTVPGTSSSDFLPTRLRPYRAHLILGFIVALPHNSTNTPSPDSSDTSPRVCVPASPR